MPITLGMLAPRRVSQLAYQAVSLDTVARTTYTFSSISFGTAAADRLIVVQVYVDNGSASSVTIGGVTATQIRSATDGSANHYFFAATVPTGTSGSIVVNGANTPGSAGIIVWTLYGVNATPKSTGVKASTSSYPALTLAANDIAIFGDWGGTGTTYTNATKDATFTDNGEDVTGASYRAPSAETRTVSNTSGRSVVSIYAVWGT